MVPFASNFFSRFSSADLKKGFCKNFNTRLSDPVHTFIYYRTCFAAAAAAAAARFFILLLLFNLGIEDLFFVEAEQAGSQIGRQVGRQAGRQAGNLVKSGRKQEVPSRIGEKIVKIKK